ncbi:MAG: DUF4430 domain-containing protein [bacterium]|nr:DUF4430 domain-containing protein [bacterium]
MHNNRFRIGFGVVALLAAAVPFLFTQGESNPSVEYLKSKPLSAWSSMALSGAGENHSLEFLKEVRGEKAIDLEAPILALTAAGKDPRTFGAEHLVAKLRNFYDGTELGEAGILNDDIFGLLALVASGESSDDSVLSGIRSFILSKQNADGGFSFAIGGTSDTNTTAAAIMALRAAGVASADTAIANAIAYLQGAQNEDGGFPYDPKSAWGTGSDASSDAWVIMALRSAGRDAGTWQKSAGTPVSHLETLKQEGGWYLYQAGGAEDSFTPVTTSYALLALSGKTLPVRVITPETPSGASFSVQVEGKGGLLCDAEGTGVTAFDALKIAVAQCNLAYHVQSSSLGDYVDEIAGEKASGTSGWLYTINGQLASVGASAYTLAGGDAVRWYFGNFDGTSANELRSEIPLSVTIPAGGGESNNDNHNNDDNDTEEEHTVSVIVEVGKTKTGSPLAFGSISRGSIETKGISVRNAGAVAATLSAGVSGDAVFRRYLRLGGVLPRDFRAELPAQGATTTTLFLSIPSDYSGSGHKTGALIFWATPAAQ